MGPVEDGLDVGLPDFVVIAVTDGGLKQHTNGVRQLLDAGVAESGQVVVTVRRAGVFEVLLHRLVEGVGLGARSEGTRRVLNELVALGSDEFLHIGLSVFLID